MAITRLFLNSVVLRLIILLSCICKKVFKDLKSCDMSILRYIHKCELTGGGPF